VLVLAVSWGYLIGFSTIPAAAAYFVGRAYIRHGWPRSEGAGWRTNLRTGVGLVVGFYVFSYVFYLAATNDSTLANSLSSPPTPMDKWVSAVFQPIRNEMKASIASLKTAEAGNSVKEMNRTCSSTEAYLNTAWSSKPQPPVVAFRPYYKNWMVDTLGFFHTCSEATSSAQFFQSGMGQAVWSLALDEARRSDTALAALINEASKIGG
jgi:hypothetical protein